MGELKCYTVVTFHTSKSGLNCGGGGLKCYTVVGGLKCYCGHASLLPSHPFPPAAWGPGIVEQLLRLQCWGSSLGNVSADKYGLVEKVHNLSFQMGYSFCIVCVYSFLINSQHVPR